MLNRFSILIILRVGLIVVNAIALGWIFGDRQLLINQVVLALVLIVQVAGLIHRVNHTNRELSRLFLAIRHSDFSSSFNRQNSLGKSFRELHESLDEIIRAYRDVKIEREIQYQFLQMLVDNIQVGIISLQGGNVELINRAAESILDVEGVRNWKLICQFAPAFAQEVEQIRPQGRKLVEVTTGSGTRVIALDVKTALTLDKQYTLITLQDFNAEIEQKEVEAWHKLIRILTHEIMNSVTPIASLSETLQGMLTDRDGRQKASDSLLPETIGDIRFSLGTIQNRSEGLLQFVNNYRKLARVPRPVRERVDAGEFLAGIETLMRAELERKAINFNVVLPGETLLLDMDPTLMQQVLINLITNSIHAVEDSAVKTIVIRVVVVNEHRAAFEITDTGKGIPSKEVKEIFVPFFSTKKGGSGIGLSLSKQIVILHGGSIRVQSVPGEGTMFQVELNRCHR